MIAPNESGRPTEAGTPDGDGTVQGARSTAPNDSTPSVTWEVTMLHEPGDFDRLICPCNDGPTMCDECRAAAVRWRAVRKFREHIAREDAVASQVERFREGEGLELDAAGDLLCTTCGLFCSLAAKQACGTCLGGAL